MLRASCVSRDERGASLSESLLSAEPGQCRGSDVPGSTGGSTRASHSCSLA